jgi:hypothetical protein
MSCDFDATTYARMMDEYTKDVPADMKRDVEEEFNLAITDSRMTWTTLLAALKMLKIEVAVTPEQVVSGRYAILEHEGTKSRRLVTVL